MTVQLGSEENRSVFEYLVSSAEFSHFLLECFDTLGFSGSNVTPLAIFDLGTGEVKHAVSPTSFPISATLTESLPTVTDTRPDDR